MVLKELILNNFYFGKVWWSWQKWFWTVSTLGGCGGLERTYFEQFLFWEGLGVLKELILNSLYFGTVWWSWKNWFWTVSTLGGCGGRCGGAVVLKELTFEQFLLWEGVVVGVVVQWSWQNWFWTVSTLGGCGGLERPDFEQFSTLGRYDGLERTDFEQFLLWEGVVVLKELILNSFYFGRVWWSWKTWFWTVSILGQCGGLERTYFEQFLLWEGVEVGVVVLKELILNSVSTLGGCGGRCGGRCGGLERTNFEQFLFWDSVVVLKELILNSFYFGRV